MRGQPPLEIAQRARLSIWFTLGILSRRDSGSSLLMLLLLNPFDRGRSGCVVWKFYWFGAENISDLIDSQSDGAGGGAGAPTPRFTMIN